MVERANAPTQTAERELVITRVFDAPRELVWKAWTDRGHVLKWLGPKHFTAVDFELEPRPGGAWHSRMRGPDGAEYSNGGTVREVDEPERLVFTFAWDAEDGTPGRQMQITITFAEREGKTEMTFSQGVFESAEDRDGHREGWSESFDRLAEYLATI
jgi:uncharacterized protein YndB with AHSA1/START domain